MKLYNSLTRNIEEFEPITGKQVGMYSCGPTVYDNAHIGHMRKYVADDILRRILDYLGYEVKMVMNITDVGHLVSDADEGEDKMEKGARKHNLNVWELAAHFTDQFFSSTDALNISRPQVICKATDYIPEQIALVQRLEAKGFTYQIDDGVYFDTAKLATYGELSDMEAIEAGARVSVNEQKRNKSDFALWKKAHFNVKRQMEWDSPWGVGFPGWHLECSAMSMAHLGEQFDIHTGGIDHKQIHHPNEIAQSEAATGKRPFVKYFVHYNFLTIEGEKMSKSLGNLYTVGDVVSKGIEPLALRYLFLQTHYRKQLNFTFDALRASQAALNRLRRVISNTDLEATETGATAYEGQFIEAIGDDMNMPQALAVVWEVVKAKLNPTAKRKLVKQFDRVLGLDLIQEKPTIANDIWQMVEKREQLRQSNDYGAADQLREAILERGYQVEDTVHGPSLVPRTR